MIAAASAALRRPAPGVSLAVVIALAAAFIADHYGGPLLLYALFFGIAFHFLSYDPRIAPGIDFCSKTLLRLGVALLGARITIAQVAAIGPQPVAVTALGVALTIGFGWLLARRLGLRREEGVLTGGAVAICGASAALAISAVLPPTKENEEFTLLTVVGVTTLSTLAMILYPPLAALLHLSGAEAGWFLGGTIHDVAQVVAAGFMISREAGDTATVIKLFRVALLVPVVVVLGFAFRGPRSADAERSLPAPLFLIGFAALVLANSMSLVPPMGVEALSFVSRALLVTAIAALGVKTSFQNLAKLGAKPVIMMVGETVFLALFILAALFLAR